VENATLKNYSAELHREEPAQILQRSLQSSAAVWLTRPRQRLFKLDGRWEHTFQPSPTGIDWPGGLQAGPWVGYPGVFGNPMGMG